MKKKEGKIARRTIAGLALLVVVLIVSICTSIGVQVQHEMITQYSDFAFSYTRAAAKYIDGDKIAEYLATGVTDEYYDEVNRYLYSTADETNIQYFYVFVPHENDLTYIWDAEVGEEPMSLLDTEKYTDETAKEMAKKVFQTNAPEEYQSYRDGDLFVITASSPLLDSQGNPVAIVAADMSVEGIAESSRTVLTSVILSTIFIMIAAVVIYYGVTKKKLVDPIIKLHKASEDIIENIENDQPISIDIHTNDEIEMLADSFENMDLKLRDYIRQNATITAERERIGAELSLATRIQADMLPNVFPAFPGRDDFDIYATMTPAKEVGGDFYDFFLIDETHLAMVIADVSGKGIPAALFMMMSKILIQSEAMNGSSPSEVLAAVNNQICSNNREEMFVTVWLGIIDLESGHLVAANAGHEKPIIKKPDGDFEFHRDRHGFVLGGIEGMQYKEYDILLEKGAKLFIYTDGVVEATNKEDALFGVERTLQALNDNKDESPQAILTAVKERVDGFVGDEPQFDDLTMLCFEYIGATDEITIAATRENVSAAVDFVRRKAKQLPFSQKERNQLEIATDEIVCNIASYAYEGKEGTVTIRTQHKDNGLTITVSDSGIPYNPLEKEDPDITLSADERGIGGYGIFIVKQVMDDIAYEYKDGCNQLIMKKTYQK